MNAGQVPLLPDGLPEPIDDGRADHLRGMALPAVTLLSSGGGAVNLDDLPALSVLVCHPMIGAPSQDLPERWDAIPGARGCSVQAHRFARAHHQLLAAGAAVFGVSGQDHHEQVEAVKRLELPYPLLSDPEFSFADAVRLPTFAAHGRRYLSRTTLLIRRGVITDLVYPVFPPGSDVDRVLSWLH